MVGYAVMYLWTRQREFLDVATHAANWWLAHAPVDRVAFWDFDAPAGPDTSRDTSGTAIAAAALLKLAALAPEETQRARYQAAAEATVTALVERPGRFTVRAGGVRVGAGEGDAAKAKKTPGSEIRGALRL
jgi:unsaturated chondroitin disaccharide hydrolase